MRICLKSLALLLMLGLCLTARADEPAKVLPAEEARNNIDKEGTYRMKAVVVSAAPRKNFIFINSMKNFRDLNCLTIAIPAPNGTFEDKQVTELQARYKDKTIEITGKPTLFQGRAQFKIAYGELATHIKVSGAKGGQALIAHMVYFTLKDNSAEAKQKLVDACDKYLTGHDGTVYYGTGIRGEEFDREVNQKDFDVALHIVFADKASHDKYQDHERHLEFIKENKDNWKQVRVFDSVITKK